MIWLRRIAAPALIIGALLLASCSQEPASGPLSPMHAAGKRREAKSSLTQNSASTVRPVQRLKTSSLAKSGYNSAKVQQELRAFNEEVQAIIDNRPGWAVENKLNDVLRESNDALARLWRIPADDRGALYKIDRAKDRLQEAISRWLLLPQQGSQFIAQLAEIEAQIESGVSQSDDYRGRSKYLWVKRNYGGLIKFAGHSIDVPKYATKYDAQFSINISPNDYITVDFGPDGWFDQQVTVTISYKDADLTGVDPSKLTLAWYDETTGQWVDLGGVVDLIKKTVTAKAWHFTQYTISTK